MRGAWATGCSRLLQYQPANATKKIAKATAAAIAIVLLFDLIVLCDIAAKLVSDVGGNSRLKSTVSSRAD